MPDDIPSQTPPSRPASPRYLSVAARQPYRWSISHQESPIAPSTLSLDPSSTRLQSVDRIFSPDFVAKASDLLEIPPSISTSLPAPTSDVSAFPPVGDHAAVAESSSSSQPQALWGNPFADAAVRDAILNYAYKLYEDGKSNSTSGLSFVPYAVAVTRDPSKEQILAAGLLPILSSLRSLHPSHPPTLLVLGCVYYALGDFNTSLSINRQILDIDPNYAEALCNSGTALRAMGNLSDANAAWWAALRLRPYYWVAAENLLALSVNAKQAQHTLPAYQEALDVCQFVITQNMAPDGRLLTPIVLEEIYHLQWIYYTNAKLFSMAEPGSSMKPLSNYSAAVELALRVPHGDPDAENYSFVDFVIAAGLASLAISLGPGQSLSQPICDALADTHGEDITDRLAKPGFDLLKIVHACGPRLYDALLNSDKNGFPIVALRPEETLRLPLVLFPSTNGVLPAICRSDGGHIIAPVEKIRQQSHLTTSTIILSLVAQLQESFIGRDVTFDGSAVPIRCTTSLLVLLSYLGLALSPSPGIYNNLGILLSSLPFTRVAVNWFGQHELLDGPAFARLYYDKGLMMNPTNAHLLTNVGSILKDKGQISEAIRLYALAVQYNPDLDVALSNLGTSLRDLGRPWESIEYLRRAVTLNPSLHEAVCGLSIASNAICDWRGRGSLNNDPGVDDHGFVVEARYLPSGTGLLERTMQTTEEQLISMCSKDAGIIRSMGDVGFWLQWAQKGQDNPLTQEQIALWTQRLEVFYSDVDRTATQVNEGAFLIRFVQWLRRRMQYRWFKEAYGNTVTSDHPLPRPSAEAARRYTWPKLPSYMSAPSIPSILPFHTFTFPFSPSLIRKISHRNALRYSFLTLTQPWLPPYVYPPPPPPVNGKLNIGYVSADLNDHPLAHLMESVFGMHNRDEFNIFVYATTASDGSSHRRHIEAESQHFFDVSKWSTEEIVNQIIEDQIHILVNLGGYTKSARNEIFASCPAAIQMALMGFAGSMAAVWSDYLITDTTSCLPESVAVERWRQWKAEGGETVWTEGDFTAGPDPESPSDDWVYPEKMLYMPHSFMVTNHKQMFHEDAAEHSRLSPDELWLREETRRTELRKRTFPDLGQDTIIFASFNQLYKIDPIIFAAWLRILLRVPNSILWLLRFPAAGEEHLKRTARLWAGEEAASRVRFTDVAPKAEHIARGLVADLFLDTSECNAHTTAADAMWSGMPFLTWSKYSYKMCSRVGASMARATGFGDELIAHSLSEYEERAVYLANSVSYTTERTATRGIVYRGHGALINLRRNLFLNRTTMPLFDTARWVRNVEKGYREAWRRWAMGTHFEGSEEWDQCQGPEKKSGCIWVVDEDSVNVRRYD